MTFWAAPYRNEGVERDASFCWRDMEEGQGETSNDLFGQYVDFDPEAATSTVTTGHVAHPPMSHMQESFLFDQPHDGTGSSGVSTVDDFDFLSSSSQAGPAASCISHDINPISLSGKAEHTVPAARHYENMEYMGDCAISDTELPSLEDISLQSPQKEVQPPTFPPPSPPKTAPQRKSSKFVDALSSTIRKATTLRKSRKPVPMQQPGPGSPTLDQPPKALRPQPARAGAIVGGSMPVSPPEPGFIHGYCDDPFLEVPPPPRSSPVRYYKQNGLSTPADTPALGMIKNEAMDLPAQVPATSWPLQQMTLVSAPDQWAGSEFIPGHEAGWWDYNLLNQQGSFEDPSKHAGMNMAIHAQQAGLPYEYAPLPDPSAGGLMIHMPQTQAPQPTLVHDISVAGQTYLPPSTRPMPATERPHRAAPRAPSSGTRHRNLSSSPLRKTRIPRVPSASPTPVQSRHSSGGSVSSVRSASGRVPATMPGTPSNVRKRQPRRPSGSGGIEFVNFTSNDCKTIMCGVAPSGSSKTKARREKEAQEQSRRLSEVAMRLVEAAGGDVDKLAEHGFPF